MSGPIPKQTNNKTYGLMVGHGVQNRGRTRSTGLGQGGKKKNEGISLTSHFKIFSRATHFFLSNQIFPPLIYNQSYSFNGIISFVSQQKVYPITIFYYLCGPTLWYRNFTLTNCFTLN
jgi:hypothetical protein